MKTKPLPLLAPDSHTHTLTKVTTVYFWMNMQKSVSMFPWTYQGHPTYPAPYPAVPPFSTCISTSCCKRVLQASIFRGDRHLFSQAPSDGHGCGVQFFFSAANKGTETSLIICSCTLVRVYLRDGMEKEIT